MSETLATELPGEEELRSLCARLCAGQGEPADAETLLAEPELAAELRRRLHACGMKLVLAEGSAPVVVAECAEGELGELALAALALCALVLQPGARSAPRPRLSLASLTQRLPGSHEPSYVRRAVVGPLEARGLVRLVKPGQRVADAYLVAGPALAAIDSSLVRARLEELAA
jgi:hypothetical protein